MTTPTTPAKRFLDQLHHTFHVGIKARATDVEDFGLAVVIDEMPIQHFNPARLIGDGEHEPMFTALGNATWLALHDFAQRKLADPADFAALILNPQAVATARTRLQAQRAA